MSTPKSRPHPAEILTLDSLAQGPARPGFMLLAEGHDPSRKLQHAMTAPNPPGGPRASRIARLSMISTTGLGTPGLSTPAYAGRRSIRPTRPLDAVVLAALQVLSQGAEQSDSDTTDSDEDSEDSESDEEKQEQEEDGGGMKHSQSLKSLGKGSKGASGHFLSPSDAGHVMGHGHDRHSARHGLSAHAIAAAAAAAAAASGGAHASLKHSSKDSSAAGGLGNLGPIRAGGGAASELVSGLQAVHNARRIQQAIQAAGDEASKCHEKWLRRKAHNHQTSIQTLSSGSASHPSARAEKGDHARKAHSDTKKHAARLRMKRRALLEARLEEEEEPVHHYHASVSKPPLLTVPGTMPASIIATSSKSPAASRRVSLNIDGEVRSRSPPAPTPLRLPTVVPDRTESPTRRGPTSRGSGGSPTPLVVVTPPSVTSQATGDAPLPLTVTSPASALVSTPAAKVTPPSSPSSKEKAELVTAHLLPAVVIPMPGAAAAGNLGPNLKKAPFVLTPAVRKRLPEVPGLRARYHDHRNILGGRKKLQADTMKRFQYQVAEELRLSLEDWDQSNVYKLTVQELEQIAMRKHEARNLRATLVIQSWWRMHQARSAAIHRLQLRRQATEKIQRWLRAKLRYQRPIARRLQHRRWLHGQVVKIQAAMRGLKARLLFRSMLGLASVMRDMARLQDKLVASQIWAIVKAQAFCRGFLCRQRRRKEEALKVAAAAEALMGLSASEALPSESLSERPGRTWSINSSSSLHHHRGSLNRSGRFLKGVSRVSLEVPAAAVGSELMVRSESHEEPSRSSSKSSFKAPSLPALPAFCNETPMSSNGFRESLTASTLLAEAMPKPVPVALAPRLRQRALDPDDARTGGLKPPTPQQGPPHSARKLVQKDTPARAGAPKSTPRTARS